MKFRVIWIIKIKLKCFLELNIEKNKDTTAIFKYSWQQTFKPGAFIWERLDKIVTEKVKVWQWTDKEAFHQTAWENRIITCFTCPPTLLLLPWYWMLIWHFNPEMKFPPPVTGNVKEYNLALWLSELQGCNEHMVWEPHSRECSLLAADQHQRLPCLFSLGSLNS